MGEEVVIVGAGVAGLVCSIALAERGIKSLCLEAGEVGTPRVCGEHISAEALPLLKRWGIEPNIAVDRIGLIAGSCRSEFILDKPAGAMPRADLERALLGLARDLGVRVEERTPVTAIEKSSLFTVTSGETKIQAKQIVLSSGRIPSIQMQKPPMCYVGKKLHLPRTTEKGLVMHLFPGGYLGISPVSDTQCNAALIARKGSDLDALFNSLQLPSKDSWLSTEAPEFGLRTTPPWEGAYSIGDALLSLPPITGGGLANAVLTGVNAATHIATADSRTYYRKVTPQLRRQLWWAQRLHTLMSSPLQSPATRLVGCFPGLATRWHRKTRCALVGVYTA